MSYQQLAPGQAYPETPVNENMEALGQAFAFAHDKPADTDLDVGFSGGVFNGADIADDVLTCVDDDENYVVAARANGALSVSVGTTNWNDVATYGRVARVTFAGGALTAFKDERFSAGGIFDHQPSTPVAADIAITDSDGYFAGSDVEAALQELGAEVAALAGVADSMVFKGVVDCSSNPNYPAADAGDTYRVSVAGKIGGASGAAVEAGDLLLCIVDGTASGTHAGVGANWSIAQSNIDGAVVGPASATDGHLAQFDGVTGKLLKGGVALDTDTALAANSDTRVPSQKAAKAYVDTLRAAPLGLFYPGKPGDAAVILRYTFTVTAVLPAGAPGSDGDAGTGATGSSVFTIKRNGASVGTCTFGAGQTVPTFSVSAPATFSPGDILTIEAPGTADATLADFNVQLLLTRSI